MDISRIFQFIVNHYILCGIFIGLLFLLAVTEIRRGGRSLQSSELTMLVNQGLAIVLDIRAHKDFSTGCITDSINIPFDNLTQRLSELEKYKDKMIIIVDNTGQHAGTAGNTLKKLGYSIARLSGGISGWRADGLPLVKK